ncbi:MAG: hypothetical protein AAFU64_11910, partial [Bacteroidota bacterium]
MITYYFNEDGVQLDKKSGQDKVVYQGAILNNITATQFRKYAAIVYAEATYYDLISQISPNAPYEVMKEETLGIASAMINYTTIRFQLSNGDYNLDSMLSDTGYISSIGKRLYNEYLNTESGGDMYRRKAASLAVLKIFGYTRSQADIDRYQGIMYWNGMNLYRISSYVPYRAKVGFELSDPAQGQIYQNTHLASQTKVLTSTPATATSTISRNMTYTYFSSHTAGGTIFFRLHSQAIRAGINSRIHQSYQ